VTIGQVGVQGLLAGLSSGAGVAYGALQVAQGAEGFPRFDRVPEGSETLNGPLEFLTGLFEAVEREQPVSSVAMGTAFVGQIVQRSPHRSRRSSVR
jgi:hypothetical protein